MKPYPKKHTANIQHNWKHSLIGLTLNWQDEKPYDYDPEKPLIIVNAGHANPIKKIIACREWKKTTEYIRTASIN